MLPPGLSRCSLLTLTLETKQIKYQAYPQPPAASAASSTPLAACRPCRWPSATTSATRC
jgi:hypothetical protein